ncbi:MAG: ATP-binding protein [Bacteroidota bacterium]|nr:ATP-binding protein [Bacteroidota bacterium]
MSQTTSRAFAFNAITINDGLSQGMVVRMLQDRYGFMWFATLDGLNRYDGYHFVVYRHNTQDQSSITKSFAECLFEDSKGRLWIGTISGGLDLFDRETETFIHITQGDSNKNTLFNGPINSIAEDEFGNIWVHVLDKVDKIICSKNGKARANTFIVEHVRVPFTSSSSFLSITKSKKIYYANAENGNIFKLDDANKQQWSIALNLQDYLPPKNNNVVSKQQILQLLEDKANGKLYIFNEAGVICLDEETDTPGNIYHNDFFKNSLVAWQPSLDKDGIVWFNGAGGLSLFDTRTGKFTYASAMDPNFSQALTNAYSTYIDRSGLLWVGTSGYGLLKRNIRSETFHHTGTASDYSIKEADNGKVVIGNNLYVKKIFDKRDGELVDVTAAAITKNNTRYLAHFLLSPVATDNKGDWFAESSSLRYYDRRSKKVSYYALPVSNNNEYEELIQCKIRDSSGNIWLGTTEGLLRFSLADLKWTIYKNKLNDSTSISSNVIFSLCVDPLQPKKYLWIGTGGMGLNRMDLSTGKCILFSTKDGLPNNVIYGILNDDAGNLWMSTNKGLCFFNQTKQIFKNFDYKDGLQSNEFNRGAYCRTKDGCLFFGGVNGFNYFYPNEILNNMTVPQIVITSLKIHNQLVSVQSQTSALTKPIYLTKKLTLPYQQNFVSFEFASMDFTNSEKNQFQYKLQGFEKDWINSDNTHSATYTNLDPGTYTFSVRGSNNDGTWNEKGTSLQLTILPPWYMTWWFRTLLVVSVLLAAYTFYQYRLQQAMKLQHIRDRIAGDLHDEVGSNLSNIFIFSNVAQQKAKANADTSLMLQKITDYTQQSMEAMDDIVWMINTRNDRFENIMVRMRTLAAEFAETSSCALHLDFDEKINNIHLNMEDRKNFYLVYKEAINNTAKYAACKHVWINMKLNNNLITLKITDDGKGFDVASIHKGNGLFNMKKRANLLKGDLTVTSTMGEGTTMQLAFKV